MTEGRARKTKTIKHYLVEPSHNSSFYSRWKFINWDRIQPDKKGPRPKISWPDGLHAITRGPWTIPDYVEPPHFVIAKGKVNALSDFGIIDGFMFISAKFKAIVDDFAPRSCDFRLCKTEFMDGTSGPETWLCSVIKVFKESVDLPKSKIGITQDGSYSFLEYQFTGGSNLMFHKESIESHHLFHLAECGLDYFCDDTFKQACKAAKIRGVAFEQIGELSQ